MKRRAIVILLLALPGLFAQDQMVTQTFQLKYADPNALSNLLSPFAHGIRSDQQLKALTITTRNNTVMSQVDQIIRKYDVPPPNIEVTIYLMSALSQPSAVAIPQEMEGVVKQLKSTFSYKGYQLIDTQVIRVRAGEWGEASAMIDNKGATGPKSISQVRLRAAAPSTDEKGRVIMVSLKAGLKVPVPSGKTEFQYVDTGISTDVDVREGQKVVVGKANMDGSDRASIVVLMAKVVD